MYLPTQQMLHDLYFTTATVKGWKHLFKPTARLCARGNDLDKVGYVLGYFQQVFKRNYGLGFGKKGHIFVENLSFYGSHAFF